MIGILPASGSATRLGGVPKFALPFDEHGMTLLENHIALMKPNVRQIIVVTRERWVPMVTEIDQEITIITKEPSTMSDAIRAVADKFYAKKYLIGMPDTYFSGENPYSRLNNFPEEIEMGLACWEISDDLKGRVGQVDFDKSTGIVHKMRDKDLTCQFDYMWGAMRLSNEIMKRIVIDNPHPGIDVANLMKNQGKVPRAVLIQGNYFDVGTITGYQELLNSLNQRKN